ncbi:flagellar basal-body rod protein FlgG [Natranaerobius thermophilus]|uniref:Flagellar basal-body rod protein FlgG n=1 Tax=Natranaerobius thermophilus (strain ATCC BAA-1301 / DSM 18059 / JW/NM-WN-LF) TaxID=457570 RepID=B2A3F1_NATTJ|nr:flagellar basal-body rod protein FlgG [Natranaerobius thermophilus]ACB86380.1 flagellar basal-body rod protein FlgG [Natranaerobius thermophilus JW/NM-WN-LF]
MFRSLWTGASGMNAQQKNMDVVSNNLANANTTGYKNSRAEFQDLIYATLERPDGPDDLGDDGRSTPAGIQIGHGAKNSATLRDFSTGSMQETEQDFDLAIEGDGFFIIEGTEGEEYYTRDGSFKIDGEGNLVTSDGLHVQSFDGEIPQEATNVSITEEGRVIATLEDGETDEIGEIEIASFINPAGLEAQGSNLYSATAASGDASVGLPGENGRGQLQQGFLEGSNVNIAEEMVNMITAQRAYETNSKSIQSTDEMMSIANNLKM